MVKIAKANTAADAEKDTGAPNGTGFQDAVKNAGRRNGTEVASKVDAQLAPTKSGDAQANEDTSLGSYSEVIRDDGNVIEIQVIGEPILNDPAKLLVPGEAVREGVKLGAKALIDALRQVEQNANTNGTTFQTEKVTVPEVGRIVPLGPNLQIGLQPVTWPPNIGGRIADVFVKPGDVIEKGQLIGRLYNPLVEGELGSAKANLANAEANLRSTFGTDFQQQMDTAQVRVDEAQIRLRGSEARVETAKRDLDRTRFLFDNGAVSRYDLTLREDAYTNTVQDRKTALIELKTAQDNLRQIRAFAGTDADRVLQSVRDGILPTGLSPMQQDAASRVLEAQKDLDRAQDRKDLLSLYAPYSGDVVTVPELGTSIVGFLGSSSDPTIGQNPRDANRAGFTVSAQTGIVQSNVPRQIFSKVEVGDTVAIRDPFSGNIGTATVAAKNVLDSPTITYSDPKDSAGRPLDFRKTGERAMLIHMDPTAPYILASPSSDNVAFRPPVQVEAEATALPKTQQVADIEVPVVGRLNGRNVPLGTIHLVAVATTDTRQVDVSLQPVRFQPAEGSDAFMSDQPAIVAAAMNSLGNVGGLAVEKSGSLVTVSGQIFPTNDAVTGEGNVGGRVGAQGSYGRSGSAAPFPLAWSVSLEVLPTGKLPGGGGDEEIVRIRATEGIVVPLPSGLSGIRSENPTTPNPERFRLDDPWWLIQNSVIPPSILP